MFDTLAFYFSHQIVQYAFCVAVMISLSSSLLGIILVLKRFSFIGDGLSHVAFGAMAIATVLKLTNNLIFVFPITIAAAIILLWTGKNRKIHGDAALAMISVGALAIGYLVMNVYNASSNVSGDVCSTLFGATAILTLQESDVWLCIIMSIIVIIVFIVFYHRIFAVTFDETFSRATGMRTSAYNLLIASVTAVIIVLAMNLVGSLLASALIIFPALSSMRVCKSFRGVTICSAVLAVVTSAIGVIISILKSTPVGSTIVVLDIAFFVGMALVGKATGRG
ncbi:MAG: metal ABC transporter permease [Lachnospiraceae bacterium]|nr:metal ABC transporter permease [Lachnospiraceae bacterium]